MEKFLKQLPQLSQQKKKENTDFFKKLRKKKPKGLDNAVQEIHN